MPQHDLPLPHFSSRPQQVLPAGRAGILGIAAADIFFATS